MWVYCDVFASSDILIVAGVWSVYVYLCASCLHVYKYVNFLSF